MSSKLVCSNECVESLDIGEKCLSGEKKEKITSKSMRVGRREVYTENMKANRESWTIMEEERSPAS